MTHRTLLLLGALTVGWLLVPLPSARGDYLGKSAAQWQQELVLGRDVQARRSAAFALGKLGRDATAAIAELMKCAANDAEDPSVRETAAYSLGQIMPKGRADGKAVQVLCRLAVANIDERIRRSAVVALGNCGSDIPEIRSTLERALKDNSPPVRQNAAWAFGEVCQKTDTVPIASLRRALQDSDKLVKRDAALTLGKIILHQSASGNDEMEQRERARLAKVREQSREAIADLLACVSHDYLELKKAACGTLINLVNASDVQAMPILTVACADPDIEVRRNAALTLAAIGGEGSKAAVPVLQDAIRNGDPALRQMAVLAFRNIGPDAAAALPELLKALATDPDEKVRHYAAVALGGLKMDTDRTVPALVDRVADPREKPEVRVAAAMSLQTIGLCDQAVAAIPRLVQVLGDSKQPARVRERVLWALRVHDRNLANHDEVFVAMTNVLNDQALRDPTSGGKMLRFDSAFLLSIFSQQRPAPDEVFPVLLDFLKDPTIRIFTGLNIKKAAPGEGKQPSAGVNEQGGEDGRIMAVQALEKIGPDRVKRQPAIIQQLREMRDNNSAIEAKVRDEVAKVLQACGVK